MQRLAGGDLAKPAWGYLSEPALPIHYPFKLVSQVDTAVRTDTSRAEARQAPGALSHLFSFEVSFQPDSAWRLDTWWMMGDVSHALDSTPLPALSTASFHLWGRAKMIVEPLPPTRPRVHRHVAAPWQAWLPIGPAELTDSNLPNPLAKFNGKSCTSF